MNNYIRTLYIKQMNYRSTKVGSYLIIFPKANRVYSDQTALTIAARAAWSGSALFAKVFKCVSMN